MVMPAPASPPSSYALPPRRRNGCLWGCLIALLLLATPVLLAGGYGAWFLWEGYKRDPVLRLVGELVREDSLARRVLGDGAVITGVDGNYFSWMPGRAALRSAQAPVAAGCQRHLDRQFDLTLP
jgi:hypothetical protein